MSKQTKEYRHQRYLKKRTEILAQTKEWAKRNPEKRAAIRKRWKANNRPLVNQLNRLRMYREKNAVGSHTLEEVEKTIQAWGGLCAYCEENKATTIDHVQPLTKNGTNDKSNLVPSCVSCNSSKGNKIIWNWNFWWAYKYSGIQT